MAHTSANASSTCINKRHLKCRCVISGSFLFSYMDLLSPCLAPDCSCKCTFPTTLRRFNPPNHPARHWHPHGYVSPVGYRRLPQGNAPKRSVPPAPPTLVAESPRKP